MCIRDRVYISRDDICPDENKDTYNVVFKKLLDIGDFVGIKGFVFRTKMGEISVHAQELTVLSKSLRPLPVFKYKDGVAYDGFNDPELRYRQRYVDLVVNDGVKDIFMKRAAIIKTMPVSYTHLDVYKRQARIKEQPRRDAEDRGPDERRVGTNQGTGTKRIIIRLTLSLIHI